MPADVKWAAQLLHVREVSLLGTADPAFWRARLAAEGLYPAERDGRAAVTVMAAEGRFVGVRFRELSVSVAAYQDTGPGDRLDGAYLVGAWNSRRAFAFCERVFFATPYAHGDVRVTADPPAAIELAGAGGPRLRAEMHAVDGGGAATSATYADWEGPVFLPRGDARRGRPGKMFLARLAGAAHARPFDPGADTLAIGPAPDDPVLAALLASGFVAERWVIRRDATHAKSKTYPRPAPHRIVDHVGPT